MIVDITTTGSTLTANHLKVLSDGVILRSEACLAVARKETADGRARHDQGTGRSAERQRLTRSAGRR